MKGVLLLMCVFSGCTVLEQRGSCPCILHLDLDNPANQVSDSMVVCLDAAAYSRSYVVSRADYNDGLDVLIPDRNGVYVNVYDCESGKYLNDDSLVIPAGEQCPHTFMHSIFVPTDDDDNSAAVCLRKNYCAVTLSFVSDLQPGYSLVVDGNVCGYAIDGAPREGDFSYECDFKDSNSCSFRIPRQMDSSLRMGVSVKGEQPRYFAIGNYIAQSGYDWTQDELDDIVISIDYTSTEINLIINDWQMSIDMDVLI